MTESQIVNIFKEAEAGMSIKGICRKHNITIQRFINGVKNTAVWKRPMLNA